MATYTLTQNENWSNISGSVGSDDTIDLAGFQLTFDAEPTQTGVDVTTPGTAGKVVFSVSCDIPTWDFTAGTGLLIATLPDGCVINSVTAGSAVSAHGIVSNYGAVTTVRAGSASAANGVRNNFRTIGSVTGSDTSVAHGVEGNFGSINTATGGGFNSSLGVINNHGTVTTATGGSANNARGVVNNYGTVTTSTGGSASSAHGVDTNYGQVLAATDSIGVAVFRWRGSTKFVDGPNLTTEITQEDNYDPIQTLYVLNGPLNVSATIPVGVEIIELFGGGGVRNPFRVEVIG